MSGFTPEDGIQLLRTMAVHLTELRRGIQRITQELDRRALAHDLSKFGGDEFSGFARINKAAREHPYGSEEYRAGLRQEKPTIDLHYRRNSHHPEHHEVGGVNPAIPRYGEVQPRAAAMGFLDLIEMVCDWRAAYLGYGSQGTWEENIVRQRERYADGKYFTREQWWLVEQVAAYLAPAGAAPGRSAEEHNDG